MKRSFVVCWMLAGASVLIAGMPGFAQKPEKSAETIVRESQSRPPEGRESPLYAVKKGDTLYSIARTHSTTVTALKSLNGLRTDLLQIGRKLRLPASPAADAHPAKIKAEHEILRSTAAPSDAPPATAIPAGLASLSWLTAGSDSSGESAGAEGDFSDSAEPPLRYRLASAGLNLLGVRYRWNGSSARSGFDCSGLVQSLFQEFNIVLPRSSREQYKVGEKVDKDNLEVGDLVFFSSRGKIPTHVGVYLGDNMFLHAARKARKVLISNLSAAWYSKRFLGARRLLDLWQPESKPAESKTY
jgi:peptidoglycan endopeptidase LytE